MLFSLLKVVGRIRKHFWLYFILSLQIGIGLTFIVYSLNHVYSAQQRESILKEQMDGQTITINAYLQPDVKGATEPFVTYKDYKQLERISNHGVELYICKNNVFLVGDYLLEVPIIYTELKADKENVDNAYYGKNIADDVKLDLDSDHTAYQISAGNLRMKEDGKQYKLVALGEKLKSKTISQHVDGGDIDIDDCIILPLKDYHVFEQEDLANTILRVRFAEEAEAEGLLLEIQTYLEEQHGEYYRYEYVNFLDLYHVTSDNRMELSTYYGKMAMIMLIILLFGFTGVTKIFVRKREKELAICMMLGAKRKRLCIELLAEVLVVCTIGCLLGCVTGTVITYSTEISTYNLAGDWRSLGIVAFISCVSAVLIVYPSIRRIMIMKPTELLQTT